MTEFKARRHRLELPPMPNTDDPAVLKRAMDQMKRLVQDEFNRLSTDFYDFKKSTFEAGIIPLRGVANIAVTKDEYSMTATWELPDGQDITPTQVRIRILEISPNSWATYNYPKTSWSTAGLIPGTQYTLQIQLRAVFEATDSFVSTTRNCPSVPVLRTAESPIKAKVFTTDTGVSPPKDNGTNDDQVIFTFPNTAGTPGAVSSSDCWWGYKFQYRTACAWADTAVSEAFAAGNVGDVTIDTGNTPFSTYPNSLFRLAYREICDGVAQDWVYGEAFMAVDFSNADCLGIVKSDSYTQDPYQSANLLALPGVCQEDGSYLQIVNTLTDEEFFPDEPGFKCIEYIDGEWTLIADDTTDTAISPTIATNLLSGSAAALANFNAETDFTLSFEIKIADNSFWSSIGERESGLTILDLGGKIKVFLIESGTSYALEIQVPRDGGGAYAFRGSGIAYAEWVRLYYVHDVSEPNGRTLYIDGTNVAQSTNAIANDFDGITGDVQIRTVNDMQLRQLYVWDEAVADSEISGTEATYIASDEGYDRTTGSINIAANASAALGQTVILVVHSTTSLNSAAPDATDHPDAVAIYDETGDPNFKVYAIPVNAALLSNGITFGGMGTDNNQLSAHYYSGMTTGLVSGGTMVRGESGDGTWPARSPMFSGQDWPNITIPVKGTLLVGTWVSGASATIGARTWSGGVTEQSYYSESFNVDLAHVHAGTSSTAGATITPRIVTSTALNTLQCFYLIVPATI